MLQLSAVEAAKAMLGWHLIKYEDSQKLVGRIVETEAYDQTDQASHSFKGISPRAAVMFGPPGFAYVYFTYGMHYCFNVVVGESGHGSAVLIRALEPLEGQSTMKKRRGTNNELMLCNGPAKLCQAFDISRDLNGHDLHKQPLMLMSSSIDGEIVATTRIGITKDSHRLWRFYIKGNKYISKA